MTVEDDPRSPIKVDIQPSSNQKKVEMEKIKRIEAGELKSNEATGREGRFLVC